MKRFLLASTMLTLAGAAIAQTTQTGAIGGLNYAKLTSPDGCSTASPCQIVTYLHYLGGEGATADDVQKYFNNTQFWSANPHTIVLAPMINGSSDTNNWGGVQGGVSPNMQAAVDLVKQTEATNPTNPNSVVVTGGSMGGIGTQSAMIEYGPQGTTGQHVFTAGLAYDGATYNVDSATQKSALCGVPLTLVHGTADTTVSPSPDQQMRKPCPGALVSTRIG
jgi:predicted peptidase